VPGLGSRALCAVWRWGNPQAPRLLHRHWQQREKGLAGLGWIGKRRREV
jgi:hypothetical protein